MKKEVHRHLRFCFSAFLLICMVINLFKGHIVAAVCSLGACFLFFALSLLTYKKGKDSNPYQSLQIIRHQISHKILYALRLF